MTNQNQIEAPVSCTVKLTGEYGSDILFTVRSGATPTDVELTLDSLVHALKYAKDTYKLFPRPGGPGPFATGKIIKKNGPAPQAKQDDFSAPTCEYHGAMKRSTKFAGWYCPSRMGDGTYCKKQVKD